MVRWNKRDIPHKGWKYIGPEFDGELRVGCDCALKMIDSYVDPRENERDYKNKTSRRMNFLRQEWIRKTETGNYTLRYR